jgi:UPF0716 protein FxsA
MFLKLVLFAILFPTLELYLLILLGRQVGAEVTVGIVILTGVLGVYLARKNGKSVLARLVESVRRNEVPAMEVVEGLLILIGGIVLMLPGLISDTLGFLLVINPTRRLFIRRFWMTIRKSDFFFQLKEKLREELIKKGHLSR